MLIVQKDFFKIAKEIIKDKKYVVMKSFIQHGNVSCYKHCFCVSYESYLLAKKINKIFNLRLDEISIIRAGLLHDYFLYDWHDLPPSKNLFEMHGFSHPIIAKKNAKKDFNLNKIEEDIIENHMWPLTFYRIPKYKETYIVIFIDKYCAVKEIIYNLKNKCINK